MSDAATMPRSFQFGVTAAAGSLPVTTRLAPSRSTVRKIPKKIEPDEARGNLFYPIESLSEDAYVVSGTVVLTPRPAELSVLLPLIFGGTWSTGVLATAPIVDAFYYSHDRKVKVFNYGGCKVSRARLISSAGGQLRVELDIEGCTEAIANAGTFPSLSLSTQTPLAHNQSVLNIDGTARLFDDFVLTVDNGLVLDRLFNGTTRSEIPQGDQVITLEMRNPFTTDELDLYQIALAGMEADITWTNGGTSLLLEFPGLSASPETPGMDDKRQEMPLRLTFKAHTVAGHAIAGPLKITLDATV